MLILLKVVQVTIFSHLTHYWNDGACHNKEREMKNIALVEGYVATRRDKFYHVSYLNEFQAVKFKYTMICI